MNGLSIVQPHHPVRALDVAQVHATFKALAHPIRLGIVLCLDHGERSVQTIVSEVGSTQSNVSQHLAVLREQGLLQARKAGNQVFYRLADSRPLAMIRLIAG